MNPRAAIITVLLSMALSPTPGRAFAAARALSASGSDTAEKQHWHLRGQVTNLRGEPLSGAEVRVQTSLGVSSVRKLESNLKGEFETKNVEATLATMVEDAYVNHMPVNTGARGKEALRIFYRDDSVSYTHLTLPTKA